MARQKTSNIMGILIIIIGLLAGYIYYTNLIKPTVPSAPREYTDLLKLRQVSFDFSVVEREAFKNLKIFGESPVKPGVTGRKNIFAPF